MSTRYRFVLLATLAAAAQLGTGYPAFATQTSSASVCRPSGPITDPWAPDGLIRSALGVRNSSGTGFLPVLCPVVRTMEVPAGGTLRVWVDGNAGTGGTNCTLYSYAYTGSLLGSSSITGTGTFDGHLDLPSTLVPMFSSQVVLCTLPPNGTLFDIEPTI